MDNLDPIISEKGIEELNIGDKKIKFNIATGRKTEDQLAMNKKKFKDSLNPETLKYYELEIEPYREVSFSLADGTSIKRRVCSGYFEFEGEGGPAPVVYGEVGDEPLLGATTLESLGLVLNPFTRTLHPMRMLMANLKK